MPRKGMTPSGTPPSMRITSPALHSEWELIREGGVKFERERGAVQLAISELIGGVEQIASLIDYKLRHIWSRPSGSLLISIWSQKDWFLYLCADVTAERDQIGGTRGRWTQPLMAR